MRVKFPKQNRNLESGIYEAVIVGVVVRNLESRQQLKLTLEAITSGPFQNCIFFYCIMLDGTADYFMRRLLEGAKIFSAHDEFDTNDLNGKCVEVTIENASRGPNGGPNLYPYVKELRSCCSQKE
jgi:hypothetical protein